MSLELGGAGTAREVPPRTVPAFVADLRRHGRRVALVADDETVSYAELADRLDSAAADLAGPRRLVLVAARATVPVLVGYLAALRAGHVVLLAPAADRAVTTALTRAWEPDVVIDDHGVVRVVRDRPHHELHPELTLLVPTSGSTGSPRLVRLSAASLDANAAAIVESLDITADDRAATTLPLHYCYGLSVVHSNLLAGAGLLLGERSVTDPAFWSAFREHRGTSLHGVPHTFDLLERAGFAGMDLPHLRIVTQAGGRLAPDRVRRWAARGAGRRWAFVVMYGQTEATARMAYLPPGLAAGAPDSIGIPVPGGSLDVADPDDDGVGELVYRGPNVMLGYASTPADLAAGRAVDALRTGDLGRRRDDGLLQVVGRRSRFVKPCGVRVDLDGLESLLAEHGLVAAVTGGGATEERIVVAVERGASGDDPAGRVRALLLDMLPLPDAAIAVTTVDDLPRLSGGKLDHRAVASSIPAERPRPEGSRLLDRLRPRAAQGSVHDVLARALPGRPVSDDASFVDLGGDSLTYVQVSVELERVLGHLPEGWERMPLRELAAHGETRRSGRTASVETAVVLRALAIVLVVGEHDRLWPWLGGAHLLLAFAGWTFARFALPSPATGYAGTTAATTSRRVLRSAAGIAVPSSLWIAFRASTQDDVHWVDALLGGSVFRPLVQGYWFVDALVQILLAVAALFAIPVVRRFEHDHPLALPAVTLLVAGVLTRVPVVGEGVAVDLYSTHRVLWLFVLGWLLRRAVTRRARWCVAIVVAASTADFFGLGDQRGTLVAVGLLVLMLVPRTVLPRPLARVLATIASASLAIYLTHFALLPLLDAVPAALVVALALATGVAAQHVVAALVRLAGGAPSQVIAAVRGRGRSTVRETS